MNCIALSRGMTAKVDEAYYGYLNFWRWTYDPTTGYAYRRERKNGKYKKIYMHRQIMGEPYGLQVDHINRDGLDNRRQNLRTCTRSENQHNRGLTKRNTSGEKCIFWNKKLGKWEISVMSGWIMYRRYSNHLEDAVRIRDNLIKELHGEYANAK